MARTIESFSGPNSGLWSAQVELMSLLGRNDELRAFLAGVQTEAATGLAEMFLGVDPEAEPETARLAGSVYHALFIGIIAKWFMDPKQGLTAHELAEGLRIIANRICASPEDSAGGATSSQAS
jgi:hypothetical protein